MSRRESLGSSNKLRFYVTSPRSCSYLESEQAVSIFADPFAMLNQSIYNQLAVAGFRRSGNDLYLPGCTDCSACIPLRVPVSHFSPGRSQQRTWKRNQNLDSKILPAEFKADHFALYKDYLQSRHPDGGMAESDESQYVKFLCSYWCKTRFIEFRDNGKLLAVAVTDYLDTALSAVYTFFDPDERQRSLGTYAILYQIDLAKRLGLRWLYLGYWIKTCQSMNYKADYRPCEMFKDGHWQPLNPG